MIKKLFCVLCAVCVLGMNSLAAPSGWAAAEVEEATAAGFVPASFAENWQKEIRREEFAELSVRFLAVNLGYALKDLYAYTESQNFKVNSYTDDTAILWKVKEGSATFTDTNKRLVRMAADIGIIEGPGDGSFNPHKPITRQEAAVMLLRTYAAYSNSISFATDKTFADEAEVAPWANLGVRFVTEADVMRGMGENMFAPLASYTREQAVLTFLRLGKMQGWMENPGLYQSGYVPSGDIPKPDMTISETLTKQYITDPAYTLSGKWETPYGILVYGTYTHPTTGRKDCTFVYAMNDWNACNVLQPFWETLGTSETVLENIRFSEDMTEMTYDVTVNNAKTAGTYSFKTDLFLGETVQTGFVAA